MGENKSPPTFCRSYKSKKSNGDYTTSGSLKCGNEAKGCTATIPRKGAIDLKQGKNGFCRSPHGVRKQ